MSNISFKSNMKDYKKINTYCPTTWNNLSDHEEFSKRREVGKTTVSNFQTEILKTVCMKHAQTWQGPLKHSVLA